MPLADQLKDKGPSERARLRAMHVFQHAKGLREFELDGCSFKVRNWRYLPKQQWVEVEVESEGLAIANPLQFGNPPVQAPDGTTTTILTPGGFEQVDNFTEAPEVAIERMIASSAFLSDKMVRWAAEEKGVSIEQALTGDPTLTVFSDAADGEVGSSNATYSVARSGSNLVASASATVHSLGQALSGGTYFCYEGYIKFDTSGLTASANISSAVLSISGNLDASSTDFTIEARNFDWGVTVTTGDYIDGANLGGNTLVAHHDTSSGWAVGSYNDFVDDALPANTNRTGTTYIQMSSSRQRNNNTPVGNEFVNWRTADQVGTTSDPKIVYTYTLTQTVAVAQATETDTAQAFAEQKAKAFAQASETDVANAMTASFGRSYPANQATETDFAQPMVVHQATLFGQAIETDTANPLTKAFAYRIGQASESDAAQPMGYTWARTIGQVTETDEASRLHVELSLTERSFYPVEPGVFVQSTRPRRLRGFRRR